MKRLLPVLFAALMVACAGAGADSATTIAPSTTSSTAPDDPSSTTSVPTSTTTTAESDSWDAIAPWRGGAAGEYRTTAFAVPFRFATPSAWTGSDQIDNLSITKAGESGIWVIDMGFTSIDEAIAHFQNMENAEFVETTTTSIGGATGASMDGTMVGNQTITRLRDGLTLQWRAGSETTVHLVDVNGDLVVIIVDRRQPVPLNFAEEAKSILDSIQWRALDS